MPWALSSLAGLGGWGEVMARRGIRRPAFLGKLCRAVAPRFSPEVFGDFLLVQRLSRGAMTEVLLAARLGDRSGRLFVLKRPVLGERASGRAAQAIAREAQVLEAVRAPGLPALEAAGEIAGLPYLALEYVRGVALDELFARAAPLPRAALAAVARDVARALAALHAAGWVHGDVTPSNLIVDEAGEGRLLDLGLAQRDGERRAEVVGKPGYVAPEAALPGTASTAQDVYGLGVVLAEGALGRRLFDERDLVEAATRADAPRELAQADGTLPGVAAALSRQASQRPALDAWLRQLDEVSFDRAALAELVAQHAASPPAPEETAPRAQPQLRSRSEPSRAPAPATQAAPAAVPAPAAEMGLTPARSDLRSHRPLALALAGVLLFAAGGVAGRLSSRSRHGSFSLAGGLPRRAQLEIDGRPVPYPVDGAVRVPPGQHTFAIVFPQRGRREYTFHVDPNEHLVLTSESEGRRPPGRNGEEAP